jgi:hypothetical protein
VPLPWRSSGLDLRSPVVKVHEHAVGGRAAADLEQPIGREPAKLGVAEGPRTGVGGRRVGPDRRADEQVAARRDQSRDRRDGLLVRLGR